MAISLVIGIRESHGSGGSWDERPSSLVADLRALGSINEMRALPLSPLDPRAEHAGGQPRPLLMGEGYGWVEERHLHNKSSNPSLIIGCGYSWIMHIFISLDTKLGTPPQE